MCPIRCQGRKKWKSPFNESYIHVDKITYMLQLSEETSCTGFFIMDIKNTRPVSNKTPDDWMVYLVALSNEKTKMSSFVLVMRHKTSRLLVLYTILENISSSPCRLITRDGNVLKKWKFHQSEVSIETSISDFTTIINVIKNTRPVDSRQSERLACCYNRTRKQKMSSFVFVSCSKTARVLRTAHPRTRSWNSPSSSSCRLITRDRNAFEKWKFHQ